MLRIPNYRNLLNRKHPLNRGLVSEWVVLPGLVGGTKFYDIVAQNHGILTNGPTWQSPQGRPSGFGSLGFASASSQYVTFGVLSFTAITMAGWVKLDSLANTYTGIFSKAVSGTTQATLYVKSDGKLAAYCNVIDSNYDGTGTYTLTAGVWYFLAISYSAAAGLTVYVNGVLDGSAATSGALTASGTIAIGTDFGFPTSRYLQGSADGMLVFDDSLPAARHMQLYQESRLGNPNRYNYLPYHIFGGGVPPLITRNLLLRNALGKQLILRYDS